MQSGDGVYNIKFGWGVWSNSRNITYGITMPGNSDCFGCVGLKKKKYCILNKQYTKEQYEELVAKIIKHIDDMPYIDSKGRVYKYGEFFPVEFSPFGYNETTAHEYFYLNESEAVGKGYNWAQYQNRDYKITKDFNNLPSDIKSVDDSILNEVISCQFKGRPESNCMTAFKILSEDLKFYRRMNLPIPRACPNCRHHERLKQRNPLKLWHRTCMKEGCQNEFETSYAPERPEIVYCEECYKREVY
jgi:hypothetical protein